MPDTTVLIPLAFLFLMRELTGRVHDFRERGRENGSKGVNAEVLYHVSLVSVCISCI